MSRFLNSNLVLLISIALGLIGVQLTLRSRTHSSSEAFTLDIIVWVLILVSVWQRRERLAFDSDPASSFLGFGLIGLFLVKSLSLIWYEAALLALLPLIFLIGLGLIASGLRGLHQYWREALIFIVLSLPITPLKFRLETLLGLSLDQLAVTLTTQAATFGLWYLGFDATRHGSQIILPHGSVDVAEPCTGLAAIVLLLQLSVAAIALLQTSWSRKLWVPVAAVIVGFVCGAIRVGLMAAVVDNPDAFDYWHGPTGNQIFSTCAVLAFGLFCRWLGRRPVVLTASPSPMVMAHPVSDGDRPPL